MREQIHILIQKTDKESKWSKAYDIFITVVALLSIVPIMFKSNEFYIGSINILKVMDSITVYILFLDYILRWMSYDFQSKLKGVKAFIIYPITPFALIDMASMLPTLGLIGNQFRILRMLRIVKIFHYSKSFTYVANVFRRERKTLGSVLMIAVSYIFISALAMFAHEPDTFDNFFEALYWATTALTTVGYGDVYPVSVIGRLISMVSSVFGIAVIALPAGVVTAGFMEEINKEKERKEEQKKQSELVQQEILVGEGADE